LFATPAFAETSEISAADTAWMIVATALALMMTIPGLALFYSGMVRKKNVLARRIGAGDEFARGDGDHRDPSRGLCRRADLGRDRMDDPA
jgi:hypothetical protein